MILFKILLLILLAAPVIAFAFFLYIQVLRYVNRTARKDVNRTGKTYVNRSKERRERR